MKKFITELVLGVTLGLLLVQCWSGNGNFIAHNKWHCTQSIVIKTDLPREEECTQYTKGK